MKAADVIKAYRADNQELYDMHQLAVETNGEHGLLCANPEVLVMRLRRTDKEVLEYYLDRGAIIDDADEYLAALDS